MSIHCYGEEIKKVQIVSGNPNEGSSSAQPSPSTNGGGIQMFVPQEDDLVLKVAMQLYSYTNFEEVKNLTKHAKLCIERANYFAKAYLDFKHFKSSVDPNASERLKEDGLVNIYKQTKD